MSNIEDYEKQKRSDYRWRLAQRIGMIVLVLAVIAGMVALYVRDQRRGEAITQLGTALNSQRQQTIDCAKTPNDPTCDVPVAPPAEDIVDEGEVGPVGPMGPPGDQGPVGPQGPAPSFTQVQNAVDLYCSTGRCDGKRPSASQVANAVALYCDDRGECRGPKGDTGDTGEPGTDGTDGLDGTDGEVGPRGPGPTAEQISTAVATYCANQPGGSCEGPPGDQGPKGETGEPGTDGLDAVPFTFTFTIPPNGVGGTQTTYTCVVTIENQNNVVCAQQAA
jgi:hypothetical protein